MASSSNEEQVTKRWADICLEDEEEHEALFDDDCIGEEEADFDYRWCLVGRLLSGKVSDFKIFQNIMADLWKPGKGITIKILDQNRFLFQFYHEIDIQRVIDGSPWTYDRKQLIIERLKQDENPRMVALNSLDMWVQIHELKSGFKTDWAIREAARYIGTLVTSDPNNFNGVWRDYLRVRVKINAPLKRQSFLTASPWLRTGKEDNREMHHEATPPTATIIPEINAIPKNQQQSYVNHDPMISDSQNYGNQNHSHNDHVILVNENSASFSNENLIEIADLKRKRMELIASSGAVTLSTAITEDDIVANVWESNSNESLVKKLEICSTHLADWGRKLTGNFKARLSKSKKLIAEFKNSDHFGEVGLGLLVKRFSFEKLLEIKEKNGPVMKSGKNLNELGQN
ncbi:hypothetical protein G4B88_029517 [Cannabis sativa]|uniref:DUF4283 domain-containing protein n=1 Tax=Cannabis sativa TaxID=3483 RepID=A0A7J6DW74_CANSA|nr:hypothetical protein G4B88_029517 [Cannabis sativa]